METYILFGPGIEVDIDRIKFRYQEKGHSLTIYGDGKSPLDCEGLDFPKNANIIIYAHGKNHDLLGHIFELCSNQNTNNYLQTYISFKRIFSKNKPVHIQLQSCYSNSVIERIDVLPKGSTLITSALSDQISLMGIDNELIYRSADFNFTDNPFINFIQYSLINPSENKIALRTKAGYEIFTSSVMSLNDYSVEAIKAWQLNEIKSFVYFCNINKDKASLRTKKQVAELSKLYEDQQNKDWLEHDVVRYQELLLFNMANWNKPEEIKKILELGVNVNAFIEDNETALFVAADAGNYNSVKLLIDEGADVNIEDVNGNTALKDVAQKGHYLVAKLLVEAGANIDIASIEQNISALYEAATYGHIEIVDLLVKAGANKEIISFAGVTPLLAAAKNGHFAVVKYLVENGANKDFISDSGINAVLIACLEGNAEIVEYLIDNQVMFNLKTTDGNNYNPLCSSTINGYTKVVKVLLEKGADVEIRGPHNATALYLAAQNGFKDILSMLIKVNAQVNVKVIEGYTALMSACNNSNLAEVKLLLAAGVNSQEEFQGYVAYEFTKTKAIRKEIVSYEKDVLTYVLEHNSQAQFALNALENLKQMVDNIEARNSINMVKQCLESQVQHKDLDLNDICGEGGIYYDDYDL